jgi:hypothetical protein
MISRFPLIVPVTLATAIGLSACKKQDAGTPPSASAAPADQAGASPEAIPSAPRPPALAAPSSPIVVPDNPDVNSTLHELSLELRKYVLRTRSVPKNFDEFTTKGNVQPPPAPAGKKYAIDGQVIVLVKR